MGTYQAKKQGPWSLSIENAPSYFFTTYTKKHAHAFSLDAQTDHVLQMLLLNDRHWDQCQNFDRH